VATLLHYIYDPLCGWCYGAEPLVTAAKDVERLEIELHAGCLWPEPTKLPDETRRYIQQADARIAAMSGQPFGEAYLEGLLLDPTMVLDSRPTIAAVLAAESLDNAKGLDMLRAIQHAHYESGRRVVERSVLCDLASACGFEAEAFQSALDAVPVDEHIRSTRHLMQRIGARGFPTFLLQIAEDWYGVPHSDFAADTRGFATWIGEQLARRSRAAHA
jgi:putative protein-disulfide isomerase